MSLLRIAQRWRDLFAAGFYVLLYDLTSTYFESPPPLDAIDKRRYGCSRNKRGDCVHVLIALTVKPDRLPLAYEVPAGNTVECTTLPKMLRGDRSAMWQGARIRATDHTMLTEEPVSAGAIAQATLTSPVSCCAYKRHARSARGRNYSTCRHVPARRLHNSCVLRKTRLAKLMVYGLRKRNTLAILDRIAT